MGKAEVVLPPHPKTIVVLPSHVGRMLAKQYGCRKQRGATFATQVCNELVREMTKGHVINLGGLLLRFSVTLNKHPQKMRVNTKGQVVFPGGWSQKSSVVARACVRPFLHAEAIAFKKRYWQSVRNACLRTQFKALVNAPELPISIA